MTALPDLIGGSRVRDDDTSTGIVLDDIGHCLNDVVDRNRGDSLAVHLDGDTWVDDLQPHQIFPRFLADSKKIRPVAVIEQILLETAYCRLGGIDRHRPTRIPIHP